MAKLYRRGAIWWVQWQGRRRSTGCFDKEAARAWWAREQRRAVDPRVQAADEATLGEWAGKVLDAKTAGKAAGTAHMYRFKLRHVLRVLGPGMSLRELGPDIVDGYITTRLNEGAAPYSVAKELVAITQVAKAAGRAGAWVGDVTRLRPPDFDPGYVPRERVASSEDLVGLFDVCLPHEWGAVCAIMGTGARLSEALSLRARDVSFTKRTCRIRGTKTEGSDRVIPIVDRCGMSLWLFAALPWLPLTWDLMSKGLPARCRQAGIEPLTPNDLRRTVATRLIESGVDAYTVTKITGHKGITMLQKVYDRSSTASVRERIDGP